MPGRIGGIRQAVVQPIKRPSLNWSIHLIGLSSCRTGPRSRVVALVRPSRRRTRPVIWGAAPLPGAYHFIFAKKCEWAACEQELDPPPLSETEHGRGTA